MKVWITFSLHIFAVNKQDHIPGSDNQVAIIAYWYIQNIFYVDSCKMLSENNYFIYFICHLLRVLLEGASRVGTDANCVLRVTCSCQWLFAGGPRTNCCTSLNDLLLLKYKSSILHFYQKQILLQKVILAEFVSNVL